MAKARLGWCLLLILVGGCGGNPPKPFVGENLSPQAIAEITEIVNRPVWLQDTPATMGARLKLGESLRTEDLALVQVVLKTGIVTRIDRNSVVKFRGDRDLELVRGKMLIWVPPDIDVKIYTNGAIVSGKNTTVYINAQRSPQIISLDGTVVVTSKAGKNYTATTGEAISIRGQQLKVEKLTSSQLKSEFFQTKLVSGFNSKIRSAAAIALNLQIPTSAIDYILPAQITKPKVNSDQEPYYEERAKPAPVPKPSPEPVVTAAPEPPEISISDLPPQPEQPEIPELESTD